MTASCHFMIRTDKLQLHTPLPPFFISIRSPSGRIGHICHAFPEALRDCLLPRCRHGSAPRSSEFRIEESLCAMVSVVRPSDSLPRDFATSYSLSLSSALVASSKIIIGGFFKKDTGDADSLLLSAGKLYAPLAPTPGVVAILQLRDKPARPHVLQLPSLLHVSHPVFRKRYCHRSCPRTDKHPAARCRYYGAGSLT